MAVHVYESEIEDKELDRKAERRRGARFPLTMNLRFRGLAKNEAWTRGTSLNFSSTGILFMSMAKRPIHLGASLEMVVEWPPSSGAAPKRELVLDGMVIRIRNNEAAVSIILLGQSNDTACVDWEMRLK